MKNSIVKIALLLVLLSVNNFSQQNSDVDIRAKVRAQILQAQSNMHKVKTKEVANVGFPNISDGFFNLLIFVLGSIIILSLVFLRRVKIQSKEIARQFRENIRLIREESLRRPIDYSLTPVRTSLIEKIENCFDDKTITGLARKLKIAKGEIMLVNSIKNYASDVTIAGTKA